MRFGSVCSGIEGASVAWSQFGWSAAWFAEIEPFCCALLKTRYPHVENLGDITKIQSISAIDILIGGTPCQSFSVQGMRKGLDDPRGNITLRFCQIAGVSHPRWIVWENVPGVLSSERGRAFSAFVGALVKLGYCCCWRVLDAQFFGVPQRRRRVYLVGYYRDWQRPAAVLFDSPSRRADALKAREIPKERRRDIQGHVNGTLVGWTGDETPKFGIESVPTLRAYQGGEGVGVVSSHAYRRFTVTEWERLQGFPDGYTRVDFNGSVASDRIRQTAIGNSFCVPVVKWIGSRIVEVDK